MVTILIRGLNHFNIVMNFKYQHIWIMLSYKKLILRLSCLCSTPTVVTIQHFNDNWNRELKQRRKRGQRNRCCCSRKLKLFVTQMKVEVGDSMKKRPFVHWSENEKERLGRGEWRRAKREEGTTAAVGEQFNDNWNREVKSFEAEAERWEVRQGENKAVYTTAPVLGGWAGAVVIWAGARSNTNFQPLNCPKMQKKQSMMDGLTDGPTDRQMDQPTRWLIGCVAATKT